MKITRREALIAAGAVVFALVGNHVNAESKEDEIDETLTAHGIEW